MSARGGCRLALVPVLLGWMAVSTACGGVRARAGTGRGPAQEGPTVDLAVQNEGSSGAHVYALQEGHMVPVGFVDAGGAETLTLPPFFVESGDPLQVVVDLLGSPDFFQSEALSIEFGSRVSLTILDEVDRSTLSVSG